jgi:hypothetical protein
MTAHRTARTATAGRVLKSPLAVHDDLSTATDADRPDRRSAAPPSDRSTTIAEFEEYLRARPTAKAARMRKQRSVPMSARPGTWTPG